MALGFCSVPGKRPMPLLPSSLYSIFKLKSARSHDCHEQKATWLTLLIIWAIFPLVLKFSLLLRKQSIDNNFPFPSFRAGKKKKEIKFLSLFTIQLNSYHQLCLFLPNRDRKDLKRVYSLTEIVLKPLSASHNTSSFSILSSLLSSRWIYYLIKFIIQLARLLGFFYVCSPVLSTLFSSQFLIEECQQRPSFRSVKESFCLEYPDCYFNKCFV